MVTLDWNEKVTEFRKLERDADSRGERRQAEIYRALETLTLELEDVVKRLSHVEDRVQALTRHIATIESRIHEDVE
jgi:predicted  nucleic acid-binding Zn-ribbon protein